jgi:tellurite resistance protein TerC
LIKRTVHLTYKAGRRIVIAVVGATVIAIGIVMIIAPGPAIVVIPLGLAILGIEFAWARIWLRKLRRLISNNGVARRMRLAKARRNGTAS